MPVPNQLDQAIVTTVGTSYQTAADATANFTPREIVLVNTHATLTAVVSLDGTNDFVSLPAGASCVTRARSRSVWTKAASGAPTVNVTFWR